MSNNSRSWKRDTPGTFLNNSVEKANRAVKQVMSHPEETAIEHAFNSIEHAENALKNAEHHGYEDLIEQNKEQLEEIKQDLQETKEIVEEK